MKNNFYKIIALAAVVAVLTGADTPAADAARPVHACPMFMIMCLAGDIRVTKMENGCPVTTCVAPKTNPGGISLPPPHK